MFFVLVSISPDIKRDRVKKIFFLDFFSYFDFWQVKVFIKKSNER